jgi:hypothetical protein
VEDERFGRNRMNFCREVRQGQTYGAVVLKMKKTSTGSTL